MGTVWLSNGISMTGNHSETGHTVIRPWFVGYSNGPAIWMSAIRIQLYTMDINKRLDWYPDHGLMSDRKMDHLLNYRQKSPFFKPWSEYLTSILVFRCFRYLNPHCGRRLSKKCSPESEGPPPASSLSDISTATLRAKIEATSLWPLAAAFSSFFAFSRSSTFFSAIPKNEMFVFQCHP